MSLERLPNITPAFNADLEKRRREEQRKQEEQERQREQDLRQQRINNLSEPERQRLNSFQNKEKQDMDKKEAVLLPEIHEQLAKDALLQDRLAKLQQPRLELRMPFQSERTQLQRLQEEVLRMPFEKIPQPYRDRTEQAAKDKTRQERERWERELERKIDRMLDRFEADRKQEKGWGENLKELRDRQNTLTRQFNERSRELDYSR